MFGKYSVKSLKTVIDTLNSLHDRQTELEKLVTTKVLTEAKHAGDVLDYSVELQLFLELAQEERACHKIQRSRQGWKGAIGCHCYIVSEETTRVIIP